MSGPVYPHAYVLSVEWMQGYTAVCMCRVVSACARDAYAHLMCVMTAPANMDGCSTEPPGVWMRSGFRASGEPAVSCARV